MIFLLPILAVVLSFIAVYFTKPKSKKNIELLLAFSGAFLLALTFFELMPTIYGTNNTKATSLFVLAGILLQVFLEFFSKGAEHGHMHIDSKKTRFPVVLFLSLSIHAFIEGVPLVEEGSMVYGILVHKVPVAIILSIFLINSSLKLAYVILFIFLFSLMTPIGGWLSQNYDGMAKYSHELMALAVGVFLHISTIVLFESAQNHKFNLRKLVVIILGIGMAFVL